MTSRRRPDNRDREGPRGPSPPTPPDIRITYPAVRQNQATTLAPRQPGHAEPVEILARQGLGQGWAPTQPPRTMGRLGGVPGQIPAHPMVHQLAVSASPPLLPEIAAKSTPGPRVELLERGCRFRLANIRTPAIEILAHIPPHPRQRHTPSALRPPTDLRLEPLEGFPAHRAPVRPAPREAKPQERSPP